jgi:hypothetical protein
MTVSKAAQIVAENRIAEAMASGAFDALPGRGRPLALDDESAVPPEWRQAFRLLRGNGFAPAWIETAAEIRRAIDRARAELDSVDPSDAARSGAEARYARCAADLNRRIARHNLLAPAARWHIPAIDIERDRKKARPPGS